VTLVQQARRMRQVQQVAVQPARQQVRQEPESIQARQRSWHRRSQRLSWCGRSWLERVLSFLLARRCRLRLSLPSSVFRRQVRASDPFLQRDDVRGRLALRPCSTTETTRRCRSSCTNRRPLSRSCLTLWRAWRRVRSYRSSVGTSVRDGCRGVLHREAGCFALALHVETQAAQLCGELGVDAGATDGERQLEVRKMTSAWVPSSLMMTSETFAGDIALMIIERLSSL